jgi:hypothetical protein
MCSHINYQVFMADIINRSNWASESGLDFINIIAKDNYEESKGEPSTALIPEKAQKEKYHLEANNGGITMANDLIKGFNAVMTEIGLMNPNAFAEVYIWFLLNDDIFDDWIQSDKNRKHTFLNNIADGKQKITELIGLPHSILEYFYLAAYNIYLSERYDLATHAFAFLTTLEPDRPQFWSLLGLSQEFTSMQPLALCSFAVAKTLEPTNPYFHCYSAECWMSLEGWEQAENEVKTCLEMIGDDPIHQSLKEHCESLRKSIANKGGESHGHAA